MIKQLIRVSACMLTSISSSALFATTDTVIVSEDQYEVEWIEREDFSRPDWESRWVVEGNSDVTVRDGKLWIRRSDTAPTTSVATVWYRQPLPADILVRFRAQVLPPAEENYANLNLFLHARELDGSPVKFGRSGAYKEYHMIPNYIATFVGGAAKEGWSRIRRDPGFNIISEADVRSKVEQEYSITATFVDDTFRYYLDGRKIHEVTDPDPLPGGSFALRTFSTDGWWDEVHIGRVETMKTMSHPQIKCY